MSTKLADYGTYGLHVIRFSGIYGYVYGYVGTVPAALDGKHFPDEAGAIAAFKAWEESQS